MSKQAELIKASQESASKIAKQRAENAWKEFDTNLFAITDKVLLEHANETGKRSYVVHKDLKDSPYGGVTPNDHFNKLNDSGQLPAKLHYSSRDTNEGYGSYYGDVEFRW